MLYLTDEDARPDGASNPLASLWDNGSDPVAMLRHEMEVRRIAMNQFGLGNIPVGTPLSMLEAKFVPLYLHHRYQLEAAVKSVGGLNYTYAVKEPRGPVPAAVQSMVPADRQREALDAVLDTLSVDELRIPKRIVELIPPSAFGYPGGTTELFDKRTGPAFDPIGAATIAAEVAVHGLLQPERAARLIEFHGLDPKNPDFDEVVGALVDRTWKGSWKDPYDAAIARAVQSLVVDDLMGLASNQDASSQVRAVATEALRGLSSRLRSATGGNAVDLAHRHATVDEITRFLERPAAPRTPVHPLPAPPGSPIGD